VRVLPSGKQSTVSRVVNGNRDAAYAMTGQSVTLTLADELDVSRGDVLASDSEPPGVADQFEAHIIWMSEEHMLPGRHYRMKIGAKWAGITMAAPKYKINVDTSEHVAARTLELNEIGVCNINLDQGVPFDPYLENRDTGGFIITDRVSNHTVGAGLLRFALRRSQNLHWQSIEVNKAAHSALKGHRPALVWLTGLSGAGKSTIANLVEKKLHALGLHTYLLDGDNVRHGLNKDLGFTEADRVENVRRVAEVARLMVDAGLITLVSFISPFRAEREMARRLIAEGEFCEVFVDTPLAVAERRDPKGLYKKARRGELKNFTGIDSPYEPPERAEVRIDTTTCSPEEAAESIVAYLRNAGIPQGR
jgi:bifunctional enzyme CysN/CysC